MPSNLAYLALYLWPLVVIALFRKRPLDEALAWSIIAGYMLLPLFTAFDLPMLPGWSKQLVPSLFAAIMCYWLTLSARQAAPVRVPAGRQVKRQGPDNTPREFKVRRGRILYWSLIILLFASPIITTLTNGDSIKIGDTFKSGMRLYDGLSLDLDLLVSVLPFFLARRFLATNESHVVLLTVFVLAALAYSLLALWEVRMSPQLNKQIYGFSTGSFRHQVRYGGFRPVLFLYHGIWVAILFAMASIAAMSLWREKLGKAESSRWLMAGLWLCLIVILCKTATAFVVVALLLPTIFFFSVRLQLLMAAAISITVLLFPMLRGADLVPTDRIYSTVAKIDPNRAGSLETRFENEDLLLARANKKPLAGWGSWGRNRVRNEKGQDVSITDGYWVIVVGVYGWLGYIAQFGLLGISTIFLAFNRDRLNLTPATAGLCLVMAGALINLIPNASISPIIWLVAGALMGRYQTAEVTVKQRNLRATRVEECSSEDAPKSYPVTARRQESDESKRPLHIRQPRKG
ncbi:hypothetical protein [uncultured Roseovarius sp.]|uniref:hypothetical protein n=1 Tax=uncultured Roseovarius sp. TaxID=293344 RepID=UPI00260FFFDB|nr:hypothetical protein [uncultured Roseovarius sp.]